MITAWQTPFHAHLTVNMGLPYPDADDYTSSRRCVVLNQGGVTETLFHEHQHSQANDDSVAGPTPETREPSGILESRLLSSSSELIEASECQYRRTIGGYKNTSSTSPWQSQPRGHSLSREDAKDSSFVV